MTIEVVSLWENSAHKNINESLLGSAGVVSFPGLSNRCTFGLENQQAGSYAPATEFDLIMFRTLIFWELVWHLSTQVNNGDLAA